MCFLSVWWRPTSPVCARSCSTSGWAAFWAKGRGSSGVPSSGWHQKEEQEEPEEHHNTQNKEERTKEPEEPEEPEEQEEQDGTIGWMAPKQEQNSTTQQQHKQTQDKHKTNI